MHGTAVDRTIMYLAILQEWVGPAGRYLLQTTTQSCSNVAFSFLTIWDRKKFKGTRIAGNKRMWEAV